MIEPERTIFELTDRVARLEKALADMEERLRLLYQGVDRSRSTDREFVGHVDGER